MGARSWSERRTHPPPPPHLQNHVPHSSPQSNTQPAPGPPTTPTKNRKHFLPTLLPSSPLDSSALYTPSTLDDRQRLEAAVLRDRQVRLHSVQTDIVLELPPAIALPDGEEHPYGLKIHLREPEQESEIYRGYIRPPPNRTIVEGCENNPQFAPYRSSSVHKTALCSSNVVRTHSDNNLQPTCSSSSSSLVTRSTSPQEIPQQHHQHCQHYRASYPQRHLVTGNHHLHHSFSSQLRSLAVGGTVRSDFGESAAALVAGVVAAGVTQDTSRDIGRNSPAPPYDYSDAPPRYSQVVGQDYRSKQQSSGV